MKFAPFEVAAKLKKSFKYAGDDEIEAQTQIVGILGWSLAHEAGSLTDNIFNKFVKLEDSSFTAKNEVQYLH